MSLLVVGIGGTTRVGSSTEKALRVSLAAAEAAGAETVMLGADDLQLPMYAPERSERTPRAEHLIDVLRQSQGVIIASPGYHGTLSGLVKNALDYIEDMRDDDSPYLDGRAVGTIACAYGWPRHDSHARRLTFGRPRTSRMADADGGWNQLRREDLR